MSSKKGNSIPQTRPVTSAAAPAAPAPVEAVEPTESVSAFFRREDWLAALATTVISGAIFFYYMAPEVTLQDSGELVTGAFSFGVPHPPGYPLWAFLGFVWSHLIVPFGNPAWRIGTLSVFTGALTVGLLTITMTRSLRLLLHALPWARTEDERPYHWLAIALGSGTALLFGFNRGVWLWSCVSEMRVLNQFSFVLMTCTFLGWMVQPRRRGFLYVTLLLYALSFANHQTVAVMAIPFAVGALAVGLERFFAQRAARPDLPFWRTLMPCLATFWELSTAGMLALTVGLAVIAWILTPNTDQMKFVQFVNEVGGQKTFSFALLCGGLGAAGLIVGRVTGWWGVRRALACAGLFLAGASFYLYMPIAAATNPPMNWGYAATKEGFLHAVTRGQYEKVKLANIFGNDFLLKIDVFAHGVMNQYTWPLCLLAAVILGCLVWAFLRRYSWTGLRLPLLVGAASLVAGLPLLYLLVQHQLHSTEPLWIALLLGAVLAAGVCQAVGNPLIAVSTLVVGLPLLLLIKFVWPIDPALKEASPFWIVLLWDGLLASGVCMALGAWQFFKSCGRAWMMFFLTAFLCASLGLLVLINPKVDKQEQEITIKFFAPAHGFYAMLIGYGIAVLFSLLLWLRTRLARLPDYLVWAAWAVLALVPLGLFVAAQFPSGHAWLAGCRVRLHDVFGLPLGLGLRSALLIVVGLALAAGAVLWRLKCRPRRLAQLACCSLLALPLLTYVENWNLCALRGHDFGYLFGYLMFEPGGGYPSMDRDAVLYGGTDPGRFVPTYMIFCESRVKPPDRFRNHDFDRSDVYIITQNALADSTYMSYIRDHYDYSRPDADHPETIHGSMYPSLRRWVFERGWKGLGRDHTYPKAPIYIPSPEDTNRAFQEYIEGIRNGTIPASADVKIENGRVSVQGVGGVMAINGILAKWIFERNKDKHAFYVEESYVIPWMYDYLTPYGVIMKIEKDRVPSPQEKPDLWKTIVARDRAYWDNLTSNFLGRADFRRNSDAKKSFSKMRSAIAGVYEARGLIAEAEYAYRQSLALCPESPEGSFRLASLYMRLHRFSDARALLDAYCKIDVYNTSARDFLNNIVGVERDENRRIEIQKKWAKGEMDVPSALELLRIFMHLNMEGEFQNLSHALLDNTNLPPQMASQVAQEVAAIAGERSRWDVVARALRRHLAATPGDYARWIDLAATELAQNHPQETLDALMRAVQIGGEAARAALRADARFNAVRAQPAFRELVQPQNRLSIPTLPF